MPHRVAVLLALAALAAGACWWLSCRSQVAVAPAAANSPAPAPRPATAESAAAAPAAPVPAKVDHSRELALPDGTFVATLNGAVDAAPLQQFWGQVPWSPIVGVERNDQGLDWYRHADGSYSTTQMVWRSDLQREVAMTRVGHPGPAVTPPVAK
jgi:hypothetical protein